MSDQGEDAFDMRKPCSRDKDLLHVREDGENFLVNPEEHQRDHPHAKPAATCPLPCVRVVPLVLPLLPGPLPLQQQQPANEPKRASQAAVNGFLHGRDVSNSNNFSSFCHKRRFILHKLLAFLFLSSCEKYGLLSFLTYVLCDHVHSSIHSTIFLP